MKIRVNGQWTEVEEGISVAAALLNLGLGFRRSVSGEMRVPMCGMGVCFECRVRINGVPQLRSCQMPVAAGMELETDAL
jgi:sarcosine oxidase subunit alpha